MNASQLKLAMRSLCTHVGNMRTALVLLELYDSDRPRMPARLAEIADTSSANMTGIVDRLEKNGFAERVRGYDDRRAVGIVITSTGRRIVSKSLNHLTSGPAIV